MSNSILVTIFGEPKKGIHSYRLFGLAIVDVVLTALLVILLKQYTTLDYISLSILVIISFITIHKIFGVKTALNEAIFNVLTPPNKSQI